MKTIEERAIALMNTLPCEEPKSLVYEAYKLGANDQLKIDIDKACKWLMNYFKNGDFIQHYSVDNFVKNFRKAMEE